MTPQESQDERVPVTLTEATYDGTGVHIRGTIPHDQAVRLGLTEGALNASNLSLFNRWVAFTDDELDSICGALDAWIDDPLCCNPEWESTRQLRDDAKAELERRRGDAAGTIAANGDDLGSAPTRIPRRDDV